MLKFSFITTTKFLAHFQQRRQTFCVQASFFVITLKDVSPSLLTMT